MAIFAVYAIQRTRIASRPLRSYTAIQRYTALYIIQLYIAIHYTTYATSLCELPLFALSVAGAAVRPACRPASTAPDPPFAHQADPARRLGASGSAALALVQA